MKIKIDINLKVNKIVRTLVLGDFILFTGWGFISPIFPIFIISKIKNANLLTVGVAAALYWSIRAIIQLPIANFLDKTDDEQDDFYALIAALILAGFAALGYIFVNRIWELYFVQIVQAIAFGTYVPSWSGIFSRHLDEKRRSFDYSLDSTSVGLSSGIAGLLGAVLANYFGFNAIFVIGGILSFGTILVLLAVPKIIFPAKIIKEAEIHDHKPPLVVE